ncbi:sensor histidine kinase [Pseudomonas viridiflava]|uniref:sensor histidine kinase n=1 Tax=Pseudomonas viridiflava TaxID=33069 RepID=UPI0007318B26|nr:sensor histidine kinase [Pseudomonas viridiflava]KTC13401.1 histidine kinase [Pseudomonas marginalis ICMP 11289]VVM38687.1 Sensor histidine kinase RcsC [Pseudomonas fluorescens]MBI6704990.1 hybrid sensor histidine kinase/response regulator [Pseudomonas viridiflava]MBI6723228.1 hybrid sensor histidine kinase/response regulator [Pseudomonas viridiflava]MCI3908106.1 sensor histidine kinase [Pseudomonas viridiflava]
MRYLLIMLAVWLPMLAHAVEFDENTQFLPLGRAIQVFEDPTGEATIESVSSEAGTREFRPLQTRTFNAGYSHSAFWLKVDLLYRPRTADQHTDWLLELAYPPMDHVDFYSQDAVGRPTLIWQTGDMLPFASRQFKQNNYLFQLDVPPGQQRTVYLRLKSEGSLQGPLNLWSTHAYLEAQPARIYVFGLIYGVLLGMLVYNLFIFISVRDPDYLYYILYVASFGLYQMSINGVAIEYLWPNNPWWANASTPFLMAMATLFACQFSRSFLMTKRLAPWLDKLLLVMVGAAAVVMGIALFLGYGPALRSATYLVEAGALVIYLAGIVAVAKGERVGRYFVIAWSVFMVGGVIFGLMLLGKLPNTFLTMYACHIGTVFEMALLSMALADRINHARRQQAQTLVATGRDLERLNQQLATSNRLKDEFLATVTHELRTPMNGVIGSLELMQTLKLGEELEMYQQTAASSAQDMMSMINGILTLTELQAGVLYAECDAFEVSELFGQLHERFNSPAQAKSLALTFDLDDKLPATVRGDADKLYQCVECLLDNAIKFTREGEIRVRVSGQPQDLDRLRLRVEVMDTGIGFNRLDEVKLYEHFFQVDGSMTRQYGGLGIGLAICRKLVELQGGELSHHSEPGQGSCFTLSLPMLMAIPGAVRKTPELKAHWGI